MDSGYIKLWRCIKDNPIYKEPDFLAVWIHLLLSANYKETNVFVDGKKILIPRGSLLTSRLQIQQGCGVQQSKVERILKVLKSEQQIEQQSLSKCRIISITNWDTYQSNEQQDEQHLNNTRTTLEQHLNTNNNIKNIKNIKEEKNTTTYVQQKKYFIPPTVEEVEAYCNERQNNVDPAEFVHYYKANGWMVGRNSMKDWRAAVITWERNNRRRKPEDDRYDFLKRDA